MIKFEVITIFPGIFKGFISESLIARAQKKKLIQIKLHNLRKWTHDRHNTVDDKPYGGGVGMVLKVQPIMQAIQATRDKRQGKKTKVIAFSAKGKQFNQAIARRWAKYDQLVMICGRYEGIDERVIKYIANEEVSIGEYVLFGGEVPAMVIMEAVARLIPGAVGKQASIEDESFKHLSGIEKQMMEKYVEYPHYTRPEAVIIDGKKRKVPAVLLSGDHKKIEEWRKKN